MQVFIQGNERLDFSANSTSCSLISKDFMLLPTIFNSSSNSRSFLQEQTSMIMRQCSNAGRKKPQAWPPQNIHHVNEAPAYLVVLDGQGFDIVTNYM